MLQKRLTLQLQKLGAEVVPAATLEAARALLSTGTFDFALLDVNLPDGLGTELLEEKAFSAETAVIVICLWCWATGLTKFMICLRPPPQLPGGGDGTPYGGAVFGRGLGFLIRIRKGRG